MFFVKNQTQFTILLWDLPYCFFNIIEKKYNSQKNKIITCESTFLVVHNDSKSQNNKLEKNNNKITNSTTLTLNINSSFYNTYNSSCLNHSCSVHINIYTNNTRFSGLLCWLCAHFSKHHISQNSHSEYLPNLPTQTYTKHD